MSDPLLPVPVNKVFDDSVDQVKLTRLWKGLVAKRGRRTVRSKRIWTVGFAAAIVAAVLVVFLVRFPSGSPLHLANGRDVPAKIANGVDTRVSFDDGSAIDLGPESGLDLLESSSHSFAMAMRSGTITVDVTPGGPRTWRIECGPVTVEVVGTRFSVERATAFVRVAVSRGAVLVRGEKVPDHVVRLGPGQALVVPLAAPSAHDTETPNAAAQPTNRLAGSETPRNAPAMTSPNVAHAPVTGSRTSNTAPSASVARFETPDVPSAAVPSIDDGLARADVLRRQGRFAEAASVLEHALAEHGAEPSAPIVEFSLGRLYLDSMGDAGLARTHFARALDRGLPSALAEDAEARLVEASARAGDLKGAENAALRYHVRHPDGRHASDVDRWISEPR